MKTKLKASPDVNGVLRYDIPMTLSATELTTVKTSLALQNVNNTADADKPVSSATATALAGKEGTIATGATSQYRRGDKTWQDFMGAVRGSLLTGISTSTNSSISSGDTVLTGLGKAQAQLWGRVELTGNKIQFKNEAGNVNSLLRNLNTTARTYDYPDKSGTVALLGDIPAGGSGGAWVYIGQIVAAGGVAAMQDLNIIPDGYEAFQVSFQGNVVSNGFGTSLRIALGGVLLTTNSYYNRVSSSAAAPTAESSFPLVGNSNTVVRSSATATLFNLDATTSITSSLYKNSSAYVDGAGGNTIADFNCLVQKPAGSARVTGFQIFSGANIVAGSVAKVYGLKKS